jgi:hypothetical protein
MLLPISGIRQFAMTGAIDLSIGDAAAFADVVGDGQLAAKVIGIIAKCAAKGTAGAAIIAIRQPASEAWMLDLAIRHA